MDEIEAVFRVRPVAGGIVNLEFAVGRNPAGLDGRQVGADDACGGELVCEVPVVVILSAQVAVFVDSLPCNVQCPYPRPGPDI